MTLQRVEALQRLQVANGVACVALVPGANLRYFTGLPMQLSERPTVAFLPADGPPAAVLPVLEAAAAQAYLAELSFYPDDRRDRRSVRTEGREGEGGVRLFPYGDEEGHGHAFVQAAEELHLAGKAIGLEFLAMRVLEMRRIEQAAPGCRFLATEPWLPALRMAKEEGEMASIRQAVGIAERALRQLLKANAIRPGRTERQLAADLQIALLREGSEGLPFAPIVVAGPNSALPHAEPSDRQLVEGDPVILDWGAQHDGYRSDITRTFVLGQPTPQIEEVYDAVLAANQAGRMAVRPGMPAQEVDRAARRAITLAGYSKFFIHRTGHGLGLETHEPPFMVEGNLELLQPGMTFTVEPGIYLPGVGGVRIEDDVVVTAEGSETLTRLPRELSCL